MSNNDKTTSSNLDDDFAVRKSAFLARLAGIPNKEWTPDDFQESLEYAFVAENPSHDKEK